MSRFRYFVAASVLHDEAAVEKLFSRYEPVFTEAGGERIEAKPGAAFGAEAPDARTLVIFALTGGTEGGVLDFLERRESELRGRPVLIAAHPEHNSLPAALEILARVRQDGGSGTVILLDGSDQKRSARDLDAAVRTADASTRVRSLRIGAVGEPSDWLVASSQGAQAVSEAWGPVMVPVSIPELRSRIAKVRASGEPPDKDALEFWNGADSRNGPSEADLAKSYAVYRALRGLADEQNLQALTLRCFDLVTMDASTGCYALSRLADEGIDAGCEGDVPSILGLAWMRALSGRPAWMANPSFIDAERGEILLAHCTVPRKGLSAYGIRFHFESGLGVAVAGTLPAGPITLARIGGADLKRAWIAEGEITESPRREGLCRTQIVAKVPPERLRQLLRAPLGNHLVIAQGRWADAARGYLSLNGIREEAE